MACRTLRSTTGATALHAGPAPNTPAAPSASCALQAVIWFGCTSYCCANSASSGIDVQQDIASGVATATVVNSGAQQFIAPSGTARATTVNTGGLITLDEGKSIGATLNGGTLKVTIANTASGTIVNNCETVSASHGTTSATVVNNGGTEAVGTYGTTNGTTVTTGGRQTVSDGTANGTVLNETSFLRVCGEITSSRRLLCG